MKQLEAFGKKNHLNGLERPKKIYLEHESLVLKGLCTTTFKVVRASCKKHYADVIERLYIEWDI